MPIKYDKLLNLLEVKGYTSYRIRKEKIIGQATLTAIRNGTGGLDYRSIDKLCKALDCQPGDIMEYTPDESVPTSASDAPVQAAQSGTEGRKLVDTNN